MQIPHCDDDLTGTASIDKMKLSGLVKKSVSPPALAKNVAHIFTRKSQAVKAER